MQGERKENENVGKNNFEILLTSQKNCDIIPNVENIGVSPSGKASDSDSDITGVRIPAPQPKLKSHPIGWDFCFDVGIMNPNSSKKAADTIWYSAVFIFIFIHRLLQRIYSR